MFRKYPALSVVSFSKCGLWEKPDYSNLVNLQLRLEILLFSDVIQIQQIQHIGVIKFHLNSTVSLNIVLCESHFESSFRPYSILKLSEKQYLVTRDG